RGTSEAPLSQVDVSFSEPVDPIDALAPANYEMREAGADGLFGSSDDTVYGLIPSYSPGSTRVVLDIVVPGGGPLPEGKFQFTISGNTSIHDLAGFKLDGDHDGREGGNSVGVNEAPRIDRLADRNVDPGALLTFTATGDDCLPAVLVSGPQHGVPALTQDGLYCHPPASD